MGGRMNACAGSDKPPKADGVRKYGLDGECAVCGRLVEVRGDGNVRMHIAPKKPATQPAAKGKK